ncbi:MAG: hypothetical protein SFU25_06375 [Candidatus Caenarcaniphilales bacterium]|nr:hypothetical protein [Candidatus Caenarcaniphilales bacterium]
MTRRDFLIIQQASLAVFYNLLLSWLPPAPILCFLGSGFAARALLKKFTEKNEQLKQSDKFLFNTIACIGSGLVVGFVFLITLVIVLKTPLPDDWLKFQALDNLVRHSAIFKIQIYVFAFLLSMGSSLVGSIIAFKSGYGQNKISETEFLNKLSNQELANYGD